MELILKVHVHVKSSDYVEGHTLNVAMLPFDGTADGPYFEGKVIGSGVDTQKIQKSGGMLLSARYMLEGTDYKNNPCRIFIENSGTDMANCTPMMVTNSPALADWETAKLMAKVSPGPEEVLIEVFRIED